MSLDQELPVDRPATGGPSSLAGLAIVRGAGAPLVQRRLPRRSVVTLGRHDRHGFRLTPEWVPLVVASLIPVDGGWLVANGTRTAMLVENDWIRTGTASFKPHAKAMLQHGEHRVSWPDLRRPVSLSLSIRSRRREDQRIPYAVDGVVELEAPLSGMLRYRLAVLFRHLTEGQEEPRHLLRRRAEELGISEEELGETVQRFRRRLNAVHGTDLQSVPELGEYLAATGGLDAGDLDP